MRPLAGQTAIISGGLGDIGKAIALELAQLGANVAMCDLNVQPDDAFTMRMLDTDCVFHYNQVDISDHHAVEDWIEFISFHLATPTIVVANAAVVTLKSILEITPEQWRRNRQECEVEGHLLPSCQ